jgi:type IV pilus assembly protein PilM
VVTAYGRNEVLSEGSKADAIIDLLQGSQFRTRRVVTAVSGKSVIVRYLTMIQMSDDDLQNAIKFEADKYIPFDIDEVVLDCQQLRAGEYQEDGNEMKVVLVAVKRSLISEHVELLRMAGLHPTTIDVDSFALGNAFEMCERLSPRVSGDNRIIALIDIGASKTNINIMMDGTSYFTREVYLGGNDFTEAISRRLNLDTQEAEKLKRQPADNNELISDAISPVIDDLGNEIHLSIDFFENQYDREIEEIYLSGGGAKMAGLDQEFGRIFQKPATLWDPTEFLSIANDSVDMEYLKQDASQLAVAVGLATRILG